VRGVANELDVKLPIDSERSDEDIAHTIASIFTWSSSIPKNVIRVEVSQGWVTLEGSVPWNFQRDAAEAAVKDLLGVKGLSNLVTVNGQTGVRVPHSYLEAAIRRKEPDFIEPIALRIEGTSVIIAGKVRSLEAKGRIERTAWNFPGVMRVENLLEVEPSAEVIELV